MRVAIHGMVFLAALAMMLASAGPTLAQLDPGGRTIAGGGGFKVDCTGAFGESTIFSTSTSVKSMCVTVQADNNCPIIMRLKGATGTIATATVSYNNTVTQCASGVTSVTLDRAAPGALSTVNWRIDDVHNK